MACRKQPVSCRERDIAARYGLTPKKDKPWQFEGKCPACHHGGFSLTAADQARGPDAWPHVWYCNCHRCHCGALPAGETMLADGISEDCLGGYLGWLRRTAPREPREDDEAARVKNAMRSLLAAPRVGSLSEMRLRMLELIEGKAPEDWAGFLKFAERAGVPRSKRYDAAARWGRRQPK